MCVCVCACVWCPCKFVCVMADASDSIPAANEVVVMFYSYLCVHGEGRGGCIPACTWAGGCVNWGGQAGDVDRDEWPGGPFPDTASEVGGTYPTGMLSCLLKTFTIGL